jgi:hypothetical protein
LAAFYAIRAVRFVLDRDQGFEPSFDTAVAGPHATDALESGPEWDATRDAENGAERALLLDIFGNPFRAVAFAPEWRTDTALSLAKQMYESRDFSAVPILADAIQDAGCDNADILDHCRGSGPHVRGCWVVDLVLDRE